MLVPVHTGFGAHTDSCKKGTGSLSGLGGGGLKLQGRGVDPHSHIAPRLKKELY